MCIKMKAGLIINADTPQCTAPGCLSGRALYGRSTQQCIYMYIYVMTAKSIWSHGGVCPAGVFRAIAQAGGAVLWANGARNYEEAVQLCVLRLEDASRASGDAFGRVLGDLVAASKSPAAIQAVRTHSAAGQTVS